MFRIHLLLDRTYQFHYFVPQTMTAHAALVIQCRAHATCGVAIENHLSPRRVCLGFLSSVAKRNPVFERPALPAALRLLSATLLAATAAAFAGPGDLDASFGDGGRVFVDIPDDADIAATLIIQADGKLVVEYRPSHKIASEHACVEGDANVGNESSAEIISQYCRPSGADQLPSAVPHAQLDKCRSITSTSKP